MDVARRLAGFLAVLLLVLSVSLGVGRAVGPLDSAGTQTHAGTEAHAGTDTHAGTQTRADTQTHAGTGTHADAGTHQTDPEAGHGAEPEGVTGLAVSEGGYTLRPASTMLPAGSGRFSFTVTGPDERPVTAYDVRHERELHLVVVRRDLSGFQHAHPVRDAAGTWTTPLTLSEPGSYRVFADFAPDGQPARTLGVDVTVLGRATHAPLDAPPARSTVVDGYTVELDGALTPGEPSRLTARVTRDGRPVDVQPYLGADGHLVVLREGDLAYLHVHPEDSGEFRTTVPTAGGYRLFLEFRHADRVHTAAFSAEPS